jgi:hypothetical protein
MSEQKSQSGPEHKTIRFSFPEGFTGRMLGNDFLVTCHGSNEDVSTTITTQFKKIGFIVVPHVFELHANVISEDALHQALNDNDIKNREVSYVVKLGNGRTTAKVTVGSREDSDKLRKYINKDVKFTKFKKLYAKTSGPANSADFTNTTKQDVNGSTDSNNWTTVAKGKNSARGSTQYNSRRNGDRGGAPDGGYQNASAGRGRGGGNRRGGGK